MSEFERGDDITELKRAAWSRSRSKTDQLEHGIRQSLRNWEQKCLTVMDERDQLRAERDAARQELDHLKERVEWFEKSGGVTAHTRVFQEMNRAEQAEARVTALSSALRDHGVHSMTCMTRVGSVVCDCGLGAALASSPAEETKP